jgi:hypothetical protein
MRRMAGGDEIRLYATQSHDPRCNPIDPQTKLSLLRRAFPQAKVALATNAFAAAKEMAADGVRCLTFMVGEDRMELGEKLVRYRGEFGLDRAEFRVLARPPEAISATSARKAAVEGDLETFRRLVPGGSDLEEEIYRAVRLGMGVG